MALLAVLAVLAVRGCLGRPWLSWPSLAVLDTGNTLNPRPNTVDTAGIPVFQDTGFKTVAGPLVADAVPG